MSTPCVWTHKVNMPEPLIRALDELVSTGLFGRTESEAIERLVAERIRQLMREEQALLAMAGQPTPPTTPRKP